MIYNTDVVVVGGGAAGLAAALGAADENAEVILVEREDDVGGVLNQCIHNGFGLQYLKEDLTGPEFKEIMQEKIFNPKIRILPKSYILGVNKDKSVFLVNKYGVHTINTKTMVIATGARERPFSSIGIAGKRPSGVFSAGLAQRYMNLMNLKPGNSALIVGSGDIGLIMARRLTLEGVDVKAVIEIMSYPGGLERNIQQCLKDFNIPLYLSRSVKEISGEERVEKILTTKVDERFNYVDEEDMIFEVDTLISSVGLIPNIKPFDFLNHDNGFITSNTNQTSADWIFAAGNCTVVFDLVDYVAAQGEKAGRFAAKKALKDYEDDKIIKLQKSKNIGIMYPTYINTDFKGELFLRVKKPFNKICIEIPEYGIKKVINEAIPSEMIKIQLRDIKNFNEIIEVKAYEIV